MDRPDGIRRPSWEPLATLDPVLLNPGRRRRPRFTSAPIAASGFAMSGALELFFGAASPRRPRRHRAAMDVNDRDGLSLASLRATAKAF
jgi:hypothetical protein